MHDYDEAELNEVSFAEITHTLTSATQDFFRMFMDTTLLAGPVEQDITNVTMDVISIVGLAGRRIGYVMIASDMESARKITSAILMDEDPNEAAVRDAFGELANNIAGVFKSKYASFYGKVAMGLPLVVSGRVHPVGTETAMDVRQKGVRMPFQTEDKSIRLSVLLYM